MYTTHLRNVCLAIIFLAAAIGFLPIVDPAYSTDVEMLHAKHLAECTEGRAYAYYNIVTEPLLTLVNIFSPVCAQYVDQYLFVLALIILFLKILVASTFEDTTTALLYLALSGLLADNFTQTHLFRQFAASYLFLLWWTRKPSRGGFALPFLALALHNATSLILMGVTFSRRIIAAHKILFLVAAASLTTIMTFLYFQYFELFQVLYYRYGFAFSSEAIGTLDTFVFSLAKYFLLALTCGALHFHYTGDKKLMYMGIFGLGMVSIGIAFPINGELIFRILVPFKFVILPYLMARFLIDLVKSLLWSPATAA